MQHTKMMQRLLCSVALLVSVPVLQQAVCSTIMQVSDISFEKCVVVHAKKIPGFSKMTKQKRKRNKVKREESFGGGGQDQRRR